MTREELSKLREGLLHHHSEQLKEIYLNNRERIILYLRRRMSISCSQAEDVFTDALLVFRQNVISGKIQELSSVSAYLCSTCVNMVREGWNYEKRILKKEDAVRLLLYEKNHTDDESRENRARLIKLSQEAFEELPEKCRKVLMAFYVYKASMKEIAEDLGFASADVAKMTKSRCFKAWLKRLKTKMD